MFHDKSRPRVQINVITAWLDGSQIYGSDERTASNLRTFTDGKMTVDSNQFMPLDENGQFLAGDVRANENMILSSLHTLFVREHNRLAGILKNSDSRLED